MSFDAFDNLCDLHEVSHRFMTFDPADNLCDLRDRVNIDEKGQGKKGQEFRRRI